MAAVKPNSEPKKLENRRVSCETLCSSNSSCVLQKRKPLHPLARSVQTKSTNPVTQRVLSAKFLRFKTLQNQLNDANFHIAQLINENKLLKNLQRRQDHALSKYEGQSAQLPQVLGSHQEEVRMLQTKNKNLKLKLKELADQIKSKDEEVTNLRDQCKHLQSLCKNKSLVEREKLSERVDELTEKLRQSETTINVLNRKLMIESKNYKYKLNSEITKHKETQKELTKVYDQIRGTSTVGTARSEKDKIQQSLDRKNRSTVYLGEKRFPDKIKLQSHNAICASNFSDDILSISSPIHDETSGILEEFSVIDPDDNKQLVCYSGSPEDYIDSTSEVQIKEFVNNLQMKSAKLDEKIREEMQTFSAEVRKNVQISNNIIDKHTSEYEKTVKDTEIIMEALKQTDAKHDTLSNLKTSGKNMSFYEYSLLSQKTSNEALVEQLLSNEQKLNYSFEEDLLNEKIKNVSITEPEVDQTDKKKLLAKLKAIDNGDNKLENITLVADMKQAKSDLMKELFG